MSVQIVQRLNTVQVRGNQQVQIVKRQNIVRVVSQAIVSSEFVVRNYSFTAIQDQTVFTLPTPAKTGGMQICVINGTQQNKAGGDFTIVGDELTLSEGVDAGDTVYGLYQQA